MKRRGFHEPIEVEGRPSFVISDQHRFVSSIGVDIARDGNPEAGWARKSDQALTAVGAEGRAVASSIRTVQGSHVWRGLRPS